jgi:hypothetical protein
MSINLRQFLQNLKYFGIEFYDPDKIEPNPMEPLTADDWQAFQLKFIDSVNGEPVHSTGMTHSEFLDYMRYSYRINDTAYSKDFSDLLIYQGQGHWCIWPGELKDID